ncbi:MAG: putative transporter [Methanoregula sp. PtaU1.Bin051]|nr:MAG: putative transporter [Methanoregula sp. PtaU1.Bin051]
MQALHNPTSQKIILALISLAAFMATLDTSIVNISLPTIADSFHVDMGLVSWVVLAYLLVLAGLMLACGKLGDLAGFRRVFIAGFAVFTLGSLLCGLAASIGLLVAFRVVQGIGAAAIEAIAPAMIALYLPAEKRGWALGIMMTIVSLAIAAGPVLGGYITEFVSWHWIFFINVPIGIVAVILAIRYLPADIVPKSAGRFDGLGAALILVALATLIYPLNQGLDLGWTSPVIVGSFVASLLFWGLFIVHERRCAAPLIDMRLFLSGNYLWGNLAGMFILLSFAGTEFLLPFYFELVRGYSTEITGIFLAIPAVTLMLSGPVAGRITDKFGSRGLMIGAALVAGATMYLYSLFDATTGTPFLVLALAVAGFAIGLFMPPNMSLILGSGRHEEGGVASSVMMTIRNVGAVLGVAILGTVAVTVILATVGGQYVVDAAPPLLVPGFRAAFLVGMAACLITAAISFFIKEQRAGAGAAK